MQTEQISPAAPAPRLLRRDEVSDRTGLSATTIWRMQRAGNFPKSVPISAGLVGWIESEVNAWIASRIAARDAKAA